VDGGAFRRLEVDLDREPPQISARYEPAAVPSPPGELTNAESFFVYAQTKSCDCSWVAKLQWAAAGRRGVKEITDNGAPFRTVSTQKVTRRCSAGPEGTCE
jgi:hypothetical protein